VKTLVFFAILPAFLLLYSCSEAEQKKFCLKKTEIYQLDTIQSEISWERYAEYKILNKKVKLFGSCVTVNLENMNYTTSGKTPLLEGEMIYTDSVFESGRFSMDFFICRFYNEEEEAFLTTEQYPPATLVINKLNPDSSSRWIADASLTIGDSLKTIRFPLSIEKDSLNHILLTGNYLMQTLEWPIRQNPDRNNIKRDEINLTFKLRFTPAETRTDTLFNP
jgi:hypothetical protein